MPYLLSMAVAVVAVLALSALLLGQALRARRLARMLQVIRTDLAERTGLLRARVAAVRVELDRWRRRPAGDHAGDATQG